MELRSARVVETDAASARVFLQRLGPADRRARFGSEGVASVEWLSRALAEDPAHHSALAACVDGEVVGLLDVCDDAELEFGLVVGPECRRCGIGRELLRSFVDRAHRDSGPRTIVANCDASNAAALSLVRASGFVRTSAIAGGLLRFERIV